MGSYGELWGAMGSCGELWGAVGSYGEVWWLNTQPHPSKYLPKHVLLTSWIENGAQIPKVNSKPTLQGGGGGAHYFYGGCTRNGLAFNPSQNAP